MTSSTTRAKHASSAALCGWLLVLLCSVGCRATTGGGYAATPVALAPNAGYCETQWRPLGVPGWETIAVQPTSETYWEHVPTPVVEAEPAGLDPVPLPHDELPPISLPPQTLAREPAVMPANYETSHTRKTVVVEEREAIDAPASADWDYFRP